MHSFDWHNQHFKFYVKFNYKRFCFIRFHCILYFYSVYSLVHNIKNVLRGYLHSRPPIGDIFFSKSIPLIKTISTFTCFSLNVYSWIFVYKNNEKWRCFCTAPRAPLSGSGVRWTGYFRNHVTKTNETIFLNNILNNINLEWR